MTIHLKHKMFKLRKKKTCHNSCFHLVTAVASVLDTEMTQSFVQETALLLPHFTLNVDNS